MANFWLGGMAAITSMMIGEALLGRVPDIAYHAARIRPFRFAAVILIGLISWPFTLPFAYWFAARRQNEEAEIQLKRVGCLATGKFGDKCDGPWGHDWPHSFEFLDELAEDHRDNELAFRREGYLDLANYYRELADAAERQEIPIYRGLLRDERWPEI